MLHQYQIVITEITIKELSVMLHSECYSVSTNQLALFSDGVLKNEKRIRI